MSELKQYRNTETVAAYQVEEPGESVNTRDGVRWAPSGAWVVYTALGVVIRGDEEFRQRYAEIGAEENGGMTLDPSAHTVIEVIEFMELNPDLVDEIKTREAAGKARVGILDWNG